MASLDTDVTMVPVGGDGSGAAGPSSSTTSTTSSSKKAKRFEIKKWNVVVLSAWDIVVDNCAICKNHIMDLCIECQANQAVLNVVRILQIQIYNHQISKTSILRKIFTH
ncbi:RING-box protein 1a [Camellia lanceoleosa]|uniref:RING-box protein 1a n=1 Tax=Camellia lanceoleosa TaxID=1840588 RepID=A0ACC0FQB8_9ERIC|nr:RING-box protein 1a [Camellia lanceoleosa]